MRTLLALLLVVALTSGACVKKTFEPLPESSVLVLAPGIDSLEILAEPLKEERVKWSRARLARIPVEGLLRVTYKEVDYFYLQMTCPVELKCNGTKVYVPRNMTYEISHEKNPFRSYYKIPEEVSFVLVPDANLRQVEQLNGWLRGSERELPGYFDRTLVLHYLQGLKPQTQEVRVAELFLMAHAIQNKVSGAIAEPLLRKYVSVANPPAPAQSALAGSDAGVEPAKPADAFAGLSDDQQKFATALLKFITPVYEENAKNFLLDFPQMAATYNLLANSYNTLPRALLYREKIFSRLATAVPYRVAGIEPVKFFNADKATMQEAAVGGRKASGTGAATAPSANSAPVSAPNVGEKQTPAEPVNATMSVVFDYATGFRLKYDQAGAQQEVPVKNLVAFGVDNGIGFEMDAGGRKVRIEPLKEPAYLRQITPEDIKKIVAKLPVSYKELVKAYPYDRAAMYLALKYGEGSYDKRLRLFSYSVDLSKDGNFWKVLSLVKTKRNVDAGDDVFGGELPDSGGLRWYQKVDKSKGLEQFGVVGKQEFCGRECFSENIDLACFTNGTKVEVSFAATDLLESDQQPRPRIQLRFPVERGADNHNVCNGQFGIESRGDRST